MEEIQLLSQSNSNLVLSLYRRQTLIPSWTHIPVYSGVLSSISGLSESGGGTGSNPGSGKFVFSLQYHT